VADSGDPPVHGRWSGGASAPLATMLLRYRLLCRFFKFQKFTWILRSLAVTNSYTL